MHEPIDLPKEQRGAAIILLAGIFGLVLTALLYGPILDQLVTWSGLNDLPPIPARAVP